VRAAGAQAQQGEEFGQIDQSLGLGAFLPGQRPAGFLTVEEVVQAGGHRLGQLKPCQVGGEIDFQGHCHTSLRVGLRG
jgi:hypothetical protein